jgi:hypothetical protein
MVFDSVTISILIHLFRVRLGTLVIQENLDQREQEAKW